MSNFFLQKGSIIDFLCIRCYNSSINNSKIKKKIILYNIVFYLRLQGGGTENGFTD